MRYLPFLIVFLISSYRIFGQHSLEKNSLKDSVVLKLSTDTISYNQFLIMGKCKCSDILDSTENYSMVFDELYSLWTPFAKVLGNNNGKRLLSLYLEDYIRTRLPDEKVFLDFHDDVVRYRHHTTIMCERIFMYEKSWPVYLKYIHQDNIIYGLDYHLREYLLPNSDVIYIEGW
jgi:hypothetical protein